MVITIFRLIWPFIARRVFSYVADYLESRREQRQASSTTERPAEYPPCPPVAADSSGRNKIWFTLSGLLLSAAFGLMAYLFVRDNR